MNNCSYDFNPGRRAGPGWAPGKIAAEFDNHQGMVGIWEKVLLRQRPGGVGLRPAGMRPSPVGSARLEDQVLANLPVVSGLLLQIMFTKTLRADAMGKA